jgi:hypothetical protein
MHSGQGVRSSALGQPTILSVPTQRKESLIAFTDSRIATRLTLRRTAPTLFLSSSHKTLKCLVTQCSSYSVLPNIWWSRWKVQPERTENTVATVPPVSAPYRHNSPSPSGNLYSLHEEVFWALREVNYNYHVLKVKPRTATCHKQLCERGKRQVWGGGMHTGVWWGKRPLGKPRWRWEDNIKTHF